MITTTYKKYKTVIGLLAELPSTTQGTEFSEYLQDNNEALQEVNDAYNKKCDKIRRKNASVNNQAKILRDQFGNYQYTVEQEEQVDLEIDQLLDEEVEINIDQIECNPVLEKILGKFLVNKFTGIFFTSKEVKPKEVKPVLKVSKRK